MKDLADVIAAARPEGGFVVRGGRDYFMEVRETATGTLWMCADPVTPEDFEVLAPGEEYQKFGIAKSSMDAAMFRHSPNGEQEPVRERWIAGRLFINVAEALEIDFAEDPSGMSRAMVNKDHVLGFKAGRKVKLLRTSEGLFVETVGAPDNDDNLSLQENASLEEIELQHNWLVHLPSPTITYWWFGQGRSFQGPVTLPEQP
ncbi:MAG: hypothetical protein AAGI11_15555 [Pseudomonadota bacterium]